MPALHLMPALAHPPLPVAGGRYEHTDLGAGWVLIHNVPVFGELPAGERGNRFAIGRDWHLKALRDAQLDHEGQYVMPLHVGHHDETTVVTRAGYAVLKEVGSTKYRGREMSTMFADLYVPTDTADEVRNGLLPYCSVEVGPDWSRPEIYSIALLDHEPPHFKFPLITLGGKRDRDQVFRHFSNQKRLDRCGHGRTIGFRFEAAMPDNIQTQTTEGKDSDERPEGATEAFQADADNATDPELESGERQFMDEGMPVEEAPVEQPAAPSAEDMLGELMKGHQQIISLLKIIAGAREDGMDDGSAVDQDYSGHMGADVSDSPPMVEPADDDEDESGMTDNKRAGQLSRKGGDDIENHPVVVKLRADVESFKARETARQNTADENTAVAKAVGDLEAADVPVTGGMKKLMRETFKRGGQATLDLTVETFKTHISPDPPESLEDEDLGADPVESRPELEFFAKKGPEALEFGKDLFRRWEASKGAGSQVDFRTFAATEGVNIPAKRQTV